MRVIFHLIPPNTRNGAPPPMTPSHTLTRILPGQHLNRIIEEAKAAMISAPFKTLLILPTSRLAEEVRQGLIDDGLSLIESAVTTIAGYADSIIDAHPGSMTRISDHEKELIIATILEDGDYPLLAPGKHSVPGIAGELRVLFDVLQGRKIEYPTALSSLQSYKSDEIGAVFRAYKQYLLKHQLLDGKEAINHAKECILQYGGPDFVFIYGLYEPFPIECDLVLALKDSAERFLYALPWMDDSRCFADDGSWLGMLPVEDWKADQLPLARFFDALVPERGYANVYLTRYRDPVDELRGIACNIRTLIDEGVSPGDITLVFPAIADAVILIKEIFGEYGIPYSTSTGRILARSPLVQSLLLVLKTPISGYHREDLVALLRSPYFRFYRDTDGGREHLRSDRVDLLSRQAGVSGGEADWLDRISRHIRSQEEYAATLPQERAKRRRKAIEDAENTRDGIGSLIRTLNILQGERTLTDHLRIYRSLLTGLGLPYLPKDGDERIRVAEERAIQAYISVLDRLDKAAMVLPKRRMPASAFLSLLTSTAGQTRLPTEKNQHTIEVIGIREVQHLSIPHLFIAGLTEGAMPRIAPRLPLCTYHETRELETWSGQDLIRIERYYLLAALLSAEESISLSYPATDGDKVLLRSGFINSLPENEGYADGWKYSLIGQGISAGCLLAEGKTAEACSLLGGDIRSVSDRIAIEEDQRTGIASTHYDGIIGGDEVITDALHTRFGNDAVFSPTPLEQYAACPFSFFVRYVLGIEPFPEIDLDLTALERGNLLHRIAYRFYAGGRSPPTTGTFDDCLPAIRSICRDELGVYARRSPVWIVEGEKLLGSDGTGPGLLEEFLRCEMHLSESPFTPTHLEYSFGLPSGDRYADPASTTDPARIALDDETDILLTGRVDRIDTTPGGRFCIIDYKTGSSSPGYQDIANGTALQLPLYICAVETGLNLSPAGGAYYTLKKGDVKCQAIIRDQAVDDFFLPFARSRDGGKRPLGEVISESLRWVRVYLEGIRNGQFPTADSTKKCSDYCNYRFVCRFDPLRLLTGGEE